MGVLSYHPLAGGGVGIRKLSELEVDADKDWQGFGITNIREVTSLMEKGDMAIGDIVVKLIPGTIGKPLTSQGPGIVPTWG